MSGNNSSINEPYTPYEKLSVLVARFGNNASFSLVLASVSLVLLVISYFSVSVPTFRQGSFQVIATDGEVIFRKFSEPPPLGNVRQMTGRVVLGFGYYTLTYLSGYSRSVSVSLWFMTAALAIAPARRFRELYRIKRNARLHAQGRCISCGYDLRGSAGVCPECGTQPLLAGSPTPGA